MYIDKKILALPFMAMGSMAMAQTAQQRPNILYIMCDDHAIQAISAYGSPISKLAPTPNIDRLARRGMLFNNCFVENSLSAPSRACLITGLYSHQNGQRQLFEGIDSSQTFFSELLQQSGYTTGLVGKWHLLTEPRASTTTTCWMIKGNITTLPSLPQDNMGTTSRRWAMPRHLLQSMPSSI